MDYLVKKNALLFMRMYPIWISELQNPEFPRSEIYLDKIERFRTIDPVGELVADRLSKIKIVEDSIKEGVDRDHELYVYFLLYFGQGISYPRLREEYGLKVGKNKFTRIKSDILERVSTRIKNISYNDGTN